MISVSANFGIQVAIAAETLWKRPIVQSNALAQRQAIVLMEIPVFVRIT